MNIQFVVIFTFGSLKKKNNFILEKNDSEIKNKLNENDLEIYKNLELEGKLAKFCRID